MSFRVFGLVVGGRLLRILGLVIEGQLLRVLGIVVGGQFHRALHIRQWLSLSGPPTTARSPILLPLHTH